METSRKLLIDFIKQLSDHKDTEIEKMTEEIPIEMYEKGRILLRQGEVPTQCYFVLKGCVRQYSIDEAGHEVTSEFYTERQSIAIFNQHRPDKGSPYSLVCLEPCVLLVGDLASEEAAYNKNPELEAVVRNIMQYTLGERQETLSIVATSSPEIRYRTMMKQRPELLNRVPQHQLASYLGMTPESLSRIKKRISQIDGYELKRPLAERISK